MDIAARYDQLAQAFADTVAAVPADRWDDPSPCEGWAARDVVRHVSQTPGMFLGFIGRELGDIPSVDDDPLAAFQASRAVLQANLDDPDSANTTFEGFFGKSTFAEAVNRFICFDLLVHRWDLARATGLDDTIPPDELDRLDAAAKKFGDSMRSPGAFGPAIDPPGGCDRQIEVLAFLGRKAW